MAQAIKITTDQMRLMSLFESKTHVRARDCIEDEKQNRVIFVVDAGKMGKAIGKGGSKINPLRDIMKKTIEIVEYNEDPATFIKKTLNEKMVSGVVLGDGDDGSVVATVTVDSGNRGMVFGRDGKKLARAQLLAKRYFGIANVVITSPERAILEL